MPSTPFSEALPKAFDFYHLGRIELQTLENANEVEVAPSPAHVRRSCFGIAYRIEGELQGTFLLLVPLGLDVSTYSEAGNIIISRLSAGLAARHGLDTTVFPPRVLNQGQLGSLLENGGQEAHFKTYIHWQGTPKLAIELRAALLPASPASKASLEAIGHA